MTIIKNLVAIVAIFFGVTALYAALNPMPSPIEAPADNSDNTPTMSFEEYCKHFANPKNVSGFKFIVDQSESTGWVILKEGRSEYGRYGSVQEALEEAFAVKLNLN